MYHRLLCEWLVRFKAFFAQILATDQMRQGLSNASNLSPTLIGGAEQVEEHEAPIGRD